MEEDRPRGEPVPPRAPDLLVVPLDARRQAGVEDGPHVGLVDPHPEGDRRDHHVDPPLQEPALRLVPRLRRHPRVVRHGLQAPRQLVRERFRIAPGRRVDDRGAPRAVGEDLPDDPPPAARRRLGHLDRQVRPPEAVDEAGRFRHPELLANVLLHARRRGGGQRDDGGGPERREPRAEKAVVGPEIVPPVRDAVRLVDGDEGHCPLRQHLGEAGDAEPLRGDEEEVELPVEVVAADLTGGQPVDPRVDPLGGETQSPEARRLVLHEGDEGGDDERRPCARDPRELVAERLPGPGRHDEERVFPLRHRTADRLLEGAERVVAEDLLQRLPETVGGDLLAGGVGDAGRPDRERRHGAARRGRGAGSRATRRNVRRSCRNGRRAPGGGRRRRLRGRSSSRHHLADVGLDPRHERVEAPLAPPDAVQLRLPPSGQGRALHRAGDRRDHGDPLVGRGESLAEALGVLPREEGLEDLGPRRRRPEPVLLHRLGQLLLVERPAGRLHRGEQRGVGEALGRPGLLREGPGVHHPLFLPGRQPRRERLLLVGPCPLAGRASGFVAPLPLASLRRVGLHALPPRLEDDRPGGAVPVHEPRRLDGHDSSDHRRRGGDGVAVPRGQEAPCDRVVERPLVGVEPLRSRGRRDDRVVVGHLRVVHEPRPERPHPRPGRQERAEFRRELDDGPDQAPEPLRHVLREVAAVGPRVGDRLLLLVEPLRHLQRLLRAPAEAAVGMALQLGQVEEERRRRPPRLAGDRLDDGAAGQGAGHDGAGLLPARREAGPARLPPRRVEERPPVPPRLPLERRRDLQVVLRDERPDRLLPLHEHRERRRLDAAHRHEVARRDREGAGEVHPDQPVGAAPPARRVREGVEVGRGAEAGEPVADRVGGQRRDPEAFHRLRRPGRLVELPEDQLPLAPRVGRADDLRDARVGEDRAHGVELLPEPLGDDEGPGGGKHREEVPPPRLPLRPDLLRLGERHQVADRPRDDVPPSRERAVPPPRRPEHRGDVARDGRLFGDDRDETRSSFDFGHGEEVYDDRARSASATGPTAAPRRPARGAS